MDSTYNQHYYENYLVGPEKTTDYQNSAELQAFFENVAKTIVETFQPKTVLDAGCALGFLVKALRDLGVEAYGIDISEYAIAHTDESIRPFCRVCSLTDPLPSDFPAQFDLITCIEVMEHLPEADGKVAIKNLCQHTNTLLFSSTASNDDNDPTHLNVRQSDFWAGAFAEAGFYNQVEQYPTFISKDAYLFQMENPVPAIIRYERLLSHKSDEIHARESTIEKKDAEIEVLTEEARSITETVTSLGHKVRQLTELLEDQRRRTELLQQEKFAVEGNLNDISKKYDELQHAQFWTITKPFRFLLHKFKMFLWRHRVTRYLSRFIVSFFTEGPKVAIRKAKANSYLLRPKDYHIISKQRRMRESQATFSRCVSFSIVVPLYNTPDKFLREMIESVQNQTYSNWELCLADGSDRSHKAVGETVKALAALDDRIRYQKLEKNLGISENTNACIRMATGDYIALFDHDDLLHPSALYEMARAINDTGADFLYTDEATFEGDSPRNIITFHFKPDFALDNLRANNYICHFTVIARELLEKTGLFRHQYDGSQDHDMVLRLTGHAKKIYHIPKLLYFWRSHQNSVAQDINSKTYAIDAGKRAVHDSIALSGYDCVVESSPAFPTIYRIKYALKGTPIVSILIPNKNHLNDLKRCINSILLNTTYPYFEIIIIENGSTDRAVFDYYDLLTEEYNTIRVLHYNDKFNFSAINNFAAATAEGDYLITLNNDTEIISPNWIEELLMYAQRDDVGAVGAKLYFPDGTIQHAGIILGLGEHRIAGHSHYKAAHNNLGYMGKLFYAQDVSAVTAACMMVRKSLFDEVGGFDESLRVAFNDVDFCLKLRQKGYLNVFTPYAELYHYESKSRGYETTSSKKARFEKEAKHFKARWGEVLSAGDPYYNVNFSLDHDYEISQEKILAE